MWFYRNNAHWGFLWDKTEVSVSLITLKSLKCLWIQYTVRCVTPFSVTGDLMCLSLSSSIHTLCILHPALLICLLWTWPKTVQVKMLKPTVGQDIFSLYYFAYRKLRVPTSDVILSLFFFVSGQKDWLKILCKTLETTILWFSVYSKVATSSVLTLWSTLKISAEIQKGSSPWKSILLDWKVTM